MSEDLAPGLIDYEIFKRPSSVASFSAGTYKNKKHQKHRRSFGQTSQADQTQTSAKKRKRHRSEVQDFAETTHGGIQYTMSGGLNGSDQAYSAQNASSPFYIPKISTDHVYDTLPPESSLNGSVNPKKKKSKKERREAKRLRLSKASPSMAEKDFDNDFPRTDIQGLLESPGSASFNAGSTDAGNPNKATHPEENPSDAARVESTAEKRAALLKTIIEMSPRKAVMIVGKRPPGTSTTSNAGKAHTFIFNTLTPRSGSVPASTKSMTRTNLSTVSMDSVDFDHFLHLSAQPLSLPRLSITSSSDPSRTRTISLNDSPSRTKPPVASLRAAADTQLANLKKRKTAEVDFTSKVIPQTKSLFAPPSVTCAINTQFTTFEKNEPSKSEYMQEATEEMQKQLSAGMREVIGEVLSCEKSPLGAKVTSQREEVVASASKVKLTDKMDGVCARANELERAILPPSYSGTPLTTPAYMNGHQSALLLPPVSSPNPRPPGRIRGRFHMRGNDDAEPEESKSPLRPPSILPLRSTPTNPTLLCLDIAFHALYILSRPTSSVTIAGVNFQIIQLVAGPEYHLEVDEGRLRICSVAMGRVLFSVGGGEGDGRDGGGESSECLQALDENGMWRVRGGERCRAWCMMGCEEAVLHVTSV